jgi:hypothetical protein
MTDHTSLLTSLKQYLISKLEFRKTELTSNLHEAVGQATITGNINSGRIGIVIAKVFEKEACLRAELIADMLRQSRASWAPAQIVAAGDEIRTTVCGLFKVNLSEAAALSEQIGTIRNKRQRPQYEPVVKSFLDHTDQASKAAVSMVDAVISEIFAAAGNDVAAKTLAEKPSYVIHQNFQGPVASVAHGNATVDTINQTAGSATPHEIAQAVAAILRAIPTAKGGTPELIQAKTDLETAEVDLREGRVPFGRLMQAVNLFGKIEDISVRAPEVAHSISKLLSLIGMG